MYACDKEARKIYLEEAVNAFNYVLDELCHGTGSAAGYDFNNMERIGNKLWQILNTSEQKNLT